MAYPDDSALEIGSGIGVVQSAAISSFEKYYFASRIWGVHS